VVHEPHLNRLTRIRQKGLTGEKKRQYRLAHSKPLVSDFFQWCRDQMEQGGLVPSDLLTKALNYVLSRETSLKVFRDNPVRRQSIAFAYRPSLAMPATRPENRRATSMRIDDLTIDQLLELNEFICQRIDELQDQENLQALSQLRVGLKVTFDGRDGPVLGIVTKINRKSVIVLAEGKTQYKVTPNLLRPLRDVK